MNAEPTKDTRAEEHDAKVSSSSAPESDGYDALRMALRRLRQLKMSPAAERLRELRRKDASRA